MVEVLQTVGTILATGIVALGVQWFIERSGKLRETRESRRRYREDIVRPVREALNKASVSMHTVARLVAGAEQTANENGISLSESMKNDLGVLRALGKEQSARNSLAIFSKVLPLVTSITDATVRECVQKALFYCALVDDTGKALNYSEADIKGFIIEAYRKLEGYVAGGG